MSSKRRQCQNHPDVFCYICGECKLAKYCFNARDFTKRAYKAYFGIKLGDQDKSWAPHKVCRQCTETLRRWTQGKATSMRFRVFMVWREPKTHHEDCYFCMVDMTGWNQRKKKDWYYPDIESARRPVPHCTKFQFLFSRSFLISLRMKHCWKQWKILVAAVVSIALPA